MRICNSDATISHDITGELCCCIPLGVLLCAEAGLRSDSSSQFASPPPPPNTEVNMAVVFCTKAIGTIYFRENIYVGTAFFLMSKGGMKSVIWRAR